MVRDFTTVKTQYSEGAVVKALTDSIVV